MRSLQTLRKWGALAPVAEMLTPALTMLLIFQVLSGMLVAPLFSLFPVYVEDQLHLSSSFTGNLRSTFVVFGGVVALFGGTLVDRLGRKNAYLLAMTGVLASGGLFLTARPEAMFALGVAAGLMFGLGSVAGQSYLMDSVERTSLGLATAFFFMTGTAGNALGNLAAGLVAKQPGGFHLMGVTILVGQVVLMAAAAVLMPHVGRPVEAKDDGQPQSSTSSLLGQPQIRLLLLLRFLPTVYWGAITLVMPLVLFRLSGSPAAATNYTAASLVVSAICQVNAGRLIDRFGVRRPLLGAVLVLAVAAVGKALLAHQLWGLVAFGMVGAGAAWSISVTMTSLIQELGTPETKARLLGITHLFWSAGFVAGTLAGGYLAAVRGREAPVFYVGAACCVLAALTAAAVTSYLPKRTESTPAG